MRMQLNILVNVPGNISIDESDAQTFDLLCFPVQRRTAAQLKTRVLTSIFMRSSNKFDEPSLRLRAHFLPELHQNQRLDPVWIAAGAADFGPGGSRRGGGGAQFALNLPSCCFTAQRLGRWTLAARCTFIISCLLHRESEHKNVTNGIKSCSLLKNKDLEQTS